MQPKMERENDVVALAEKILVAFLAGSDEAMRGTVEGHAERLTGHAFAVAEVFIMERDRRWEELARSRE